MISFYTRALLLFRRPPCWKQHGAARTTQHVTYDSHDTSCWSCRAKTCHDVIMSPTNPCLCFSPTNYSARFCSRLL